MNSSSSLLRSSFTLVKICVLIQDFSLCKQGFLSQWNRNKHKRFLKLWKVCCWGCLRSDANTSRGVHPSGGQRWLWPPGETPCWMFGSNQSRRFQLSSCVCLHYLFPTAYTEQQFNSKAAAPLRKRCALIELLMISSWSWFLDLSEPSHLHLPRAWKKGSVKPSCSVAEVFYSSRQSLSVLLLVFYLSLRDPKKNWLFSFRSRLSEITVSTDSTQASKDIYLNI